MVIYHTLLHQINIAAKSRLKAISKRHAKNSQSRKERQEPKQIPKNIVDDFSLIHNPVLNCLLYLMVWIIKFLYVTTGTIRQLKLRIFLQNLLNDISHIPGNKNS